ncbi:hypothetical protein J4H92_04315 [Leucobacter weissii]|uniref:CU044_5270 family protein n=1 Tax=Leucobacter weissii TaxID=1983706 RepID=A0A939MLU3_9MICO|nr:hypothetical protein [Leucobacter weissii]MBO1901172.1 hypothetical protein [Leucobacter weissii]
MDNAELERRLRAARPASLDDPLPEHARRLLDDIVSGRRAPKTQGPPPRVRRNPTALAAGIAAFLVVASIATVGIVSVLLPRGDELAVAPVTEAAVGPVPPALPIGRSDWTIDALREELAEEDRTDSSGSRLGAVRTEWDLAVGDKGEELPDYLQSQTTTLTVDSELRGRSRTIADAPSDVEGSPLDPVPEDALEAGTVIWEETWEPEEYLHPFSEEPPTTERGMREYLERDLAWKRIAGMDDDDPGHSAGDYLNALTALKRIWTLGDAAERAALRIVLGAPGADVLGETVDRAGRPGILLRIEAGAAAPNYRYDLVLDVESRRVLEVEDIYAGGLSHLPLDPGSPAGYTLWR